MQIMNNNLTYFRNLIALYLVFVVSSHAYSQDFRYYYDTNYKLESPDSKNIVYVRDVKIMSDGKAEIQVYRKSDNKKQWYFYGTMPDYTCSIGVKACKCTGEYKFFNNEGVAYDARTVIDGYPADIYNNIAKSKNTTSTISNTTAFLYVKADGKDYGVNYKEISSIKLTDGKLTLVKKIDLQRIRFNPDKTQFYKTTYGIVIENGSGAKINEIETNLFTVKTSDKFMMPCMLFDPIKNVVTIFANGKNSAASTYGMEGFSYRFDLSSQRWEKEVVFDNANWGFYSFFGGSNDGNPELWHFAYSGYFALKSTRNSSGNWNTSQQGSISPDMAASQYLKNNNILVTSSPNVATMLSSTAVRNSKQSYNGISSSDASLLAAGAGIALLWQGAKWLLSTYSDTNSSSGTDSYRDNSESPSYTLRLSKGNNSTVYEDSTYNETAFINVIDGGDWAFSHLNSKCSYSTRVYDKNGKLVKSYDDPASDNSIGGPILYSDQLPVKVVVNYCKYKSTEREIVELRINKGGKFKLQLDW